MLQYFLMGLKINLENATFMFSIIRGEGRITKRIPGQGEVNVAPSQGLLPLWCHYLGLWTGTTQAVLPPLRPSCCLPTCVPSSCPQEEKQNRNSVI